MNIGRFLRPETAFFLLVWALLLVTFRERGFYDPGSLWHVKVGEIILDRGFPHTDPFTFTHVGRTWIPQQWGAEVLMAAAHRAAGLDAMLLGFATGVAGLFTWLFARMRAAGMHPLLAGVMTAACLFPGAFHYFVRPHMFTIAFLAWTTACLVDYDRGKATAWRLLGLVPVFVVWTNLHGGTLGGVMMLGLAVLWWSAAFVLGRPSPVQNWRTLFLLGGISVACLLTPFVNPFGMELLRTWTRIVGSPVLKQVVTEHMPLDLSRVPDQLIAAFGVFYLFLLAGTLPARPRVMWLLPLVWLALTTTGIRQGPLFVITAAFAIPDLWPETRWARLLKTHGDSLIVDRDAVVPAGWQALLLPALAVLAVLGLQVSGTPAPVVGRGWARLDPGYVPQDLTAALKAYARTAGPRPRVFNDANLGGYLIYHVPEVQIFMDDRFELYGDAWTQEYVDAIWEHPDRVELWCDQYGLDMAVVVTGEERSPLDKHLAGSGRWTELGRDKCAVLYQRNRPQ